MRGSGWDWTHPVEALHGRTQSRSQPGEVGDADSEPSRLRRLALLCPRSHRRSRYGTDEHAIHALFNARAPPRLEPRAVVPPCSLTSPPAHVSASLGRAASACDDLTSPKRQETRRRTLRPRLFRGVDRSTRVRLSAGSARPKSSLQLSLSASAAHASLASHHAALGAGRERRLGPGLGRGPAPEPGHGDLPLDGQPADRLAQDPQVG